MSVLIKGMDMPESCCECPCEYDSFRCNVTGTKFWDIEDFDTLTQRLPNCPLVEIKTPHGRLIDADDSKNFVEYHRLSEDGYRWIYGIRVEVHPIIEAEN